MNTHDRGKRNLFAIKNTFDAGWLPDADPHKSPNSAYDFMLNGVNQSRESKGFGVVNEESTFDPKKFPASIVGWSHIDEWNATLVFCSDGSLNLFYHGRNVVQFVCRDSEFGCDWDFEKCEFLYGEFKSFNACNELHVYWSSNCIYHVVNINEMLDPSRKASVIACEDCSYFDIFKVACKPHLSALPIRNLGSSVEGGAVQFVVQLEDNNGNQTNWFDISQPVHLETPDNTVGQIGGGGARLHIDGLDPKFDKVNIAVIKTVGGVTVYEKMKTSYSYGSGGITFDYYGQKGEVIDVATIITRKKAFLRGQDLLQVDGRMFYYNILNERNVNYQKYANQIQVNWVEYEVSLAQQKKFKYPSLMRGEVYAFGIVLCYADGTYSPVFHIPGGGGGGSGSSNATASGVLFSARRNAAAPTECFTGEGIPIDCDELFNGGGEEGDGGSGGGGGGASGGASDSYSPVMPEQLDTEEQFERKRNPSEVKDRPQESDMQEEYTLEDIRKIDTQEDDVIGIAECAACTRECWCCDCNDCNEGVTQETQECETVDSQSGQVITETTCVTTVECAEGKECDCSDFPEAMANDLPDLSNTHQNNAELLALYGRDYPDPPLEQTGTLRDAADYLVDNAVINREYITRKKPTFEYGDVGSSGPGGSPEEPQGDAEDGPDTFGQQRTGTNYISAPRGGGKTLRGDNWVDQLGNNLVDEPPRFTGSGAMQPYVSTVQYPDAKDCDGNFFYPQGPVRHNRVPWTSERPHFKSTQNGVENQYQPANDPYGNTFVRPMGAQFTGITRPPNDELPKPLCPNSWFKIVYVKRTHENKSVFAKGWFSGIFTGESYGKTYAFPRHGVNSFEHVDRFVNPDSESHFGAQSNAPMYTFHSPDTDADNSPVPADHVKAEGELSGSGWRYGLYAEGKKPVDDQWSGTRIDNLGARVANNINHLSGGGGEMSISGLGWVEGNTVGDPISGISLPLMNKYRESAWYIQTGGSLPGSGLDRSFQGDVIDHFCPTTANAPYGALIRKLPDQYGSVENLQYSELGIKATKAHAGGIGTVEGICGDTFIGPYSKRRTSYVSNKVGNFYNVPPKPGSPCRRRSICESPDDKIFEVLGIDHYPTKLPEPGDRWDPRNYCGLHTIDGECGEDGYSRKCREVPMVSETDYYWPRTLKSLVHTMVESHVNPYLLETGEGSQITHGRVYYPKLKDLSLDSHAPVAHPWEESFLNRFYYSMEQPSIKQIAKKAFLRGFIHLALPALGLTQFQELESVIDGTTMLFTFPMLAALWILMANTLFTDRRLNQMFRIGDCKRDEEGGDLEEKITNWEDAYARYNWDYSKTNYEDPMFAFHLPYVTCPCSECLAWNTDIIMSDKSRKQIGDIKVGDKVLSYDLQTNKYVTKKVTTVWDRGEKEVYRIYFRGTYVDATANHKWFVYNQNNKKNPQKIETVTTQDLVDDFYGVNTKYRKYSLVFMGNDIPETGLSFMTEEQAYILGIYIAEGCTRHTNEKQKPKFIITQYKTDTYKKIEKHLKKSGFIWHKVSQGFYIKDVGDLVDIFMNVGNGACNKRIPENVFLLKKSILEKLHEGLIDGDGTRVKSYKNKKGKNYSYYENYYTCSEQLDYDFRYLSKLVNRPAFQVRKIIVDENYGFGSSNLQYTSCYNENGRLNGGKLHIQDIKKLKDAVSTYDIEVEDTRSFILADSGALSHNCNKDTGTNNQIYNSNKQNLDSEIDDYRNVGINQYNELSGSVGKLRRLFKEGPGFFAHMTDGIYLLKTAEGGFPTDIGSQLTGSGELLMDPVLLFDGPQEGYIGTSHPNASISVGGQGYFFIDDVAKKIYRFRNGQPEEISAYGTELFFKEKLGFCGNKLCYDEKTNYDIHYSLGWDYQYNRLLVTKQDVGGCSSFTASWTPYGPDGKPQWVSLHSYIPQGYIWDRNRLYSVVGDTIWQHHKKGSYGNFYGTQYPFMLEFSATNDKDELAYRFKQGHLYTVAEIYDGGLFLIDPDITFNTVAVWNSTQGTGTRPILIVSDNMGQDENQYNKITEDFSRVRYHKEHRIWDFNEMKDLVKRPCTHYRMLIQSCDCQTIPDINEGIFDCSTMSSQDNRGRILEDTYLKYRYTFHNQGGVRLKVLYGLTIE